MLRNNPFDVPKPVLTIQVKMRHIVTDGFSAGRRYSVPDMNNLRHEIDWPEWVLEQADLLVSKIIFNIRHSMRVGAFSVGVFYYDTDEALNKAGFNTAVIEVLQGMGYSVTFTRPVDEGDRGGESAGDREVIIKWPVAYADPDKA